jgi:hypothetical protein
LKGQSLSLHSFLRSLGGKQTGNSAEFVFDCWLCGGKEKLYFNVSKLIGFCQKCSSPVSLHQLAAELGGVSIKDIQEYIVEAQTRGAHTADFKDNVLNALLAEGTKAAMAPQEISLPPSFRTLEEGQTSVTGRKAIAYMEHRGFDISVLHELQFGYCSSGYYEGRIIIPFWEDGKLVYWQARDFTGKQPPSKKIMNPPAGSVSIGKSSVLFNYDVARRFSSVIVCESWGSALATHRCAVGLNGKNMSTVQRDKLLATEAEQFFVLLDHGAAGDAWKVAEQLAAHRPTMIAFLPYGDPNEVSKHVLFEAISNAQPYNQLDHVRYVATSRLFSD